MTRSQREPKSALSGVVLLDTASAPDEAFDVSFLERNGHPVLVCHGPAQDACPLLGGEGCEMFGQAHGVVFQLDFDRSQHRAILERYRDLRPDLPIRVVVSPEQLGRYGQLFSQFQVLVHDPTAADLDGFAAEVEAADRFAE
jgi:hypothetical protein